MHHNHHVNRYSYSASAHMTCFLFEFYTSGDKKGKSTLRKWGALFCSALFCIGGVVCSTMCNCVGAWKPGFICKSISAYIHCHIFWQLQLHFSLIVAFVVLLRELRVLHELLWVALSCIDRVVCSDLEQVLWPYCVDEWKYQKLVAHHVCKSS